jgi:hypothetical protein
VPAFPLSRCPTRHDIDTKDHSDVTSGLVPSFLRAAVADAFVTSRLERMPNRLYSRSRVLISRSANRGARRPNFFKRNRPASTRRDILVCLNVGIIRRTKKQKMISNSKQNCIDDLSASITRSANWRRALQTKFPNDPRNGRAAERLNQLATETTDLSDEAWSELKSHYNWASGKWSDSVSQASRQVEFRNVNTLPAFR